MYFKEQSEFIEALYYVKFSNYNENIKNKLYSNIYHEYLTTKNKNFEFENIYNELVTESFTPIIDEQFLKAHNGKIFSIKQLINLKIKIHHFEKSSYVKSLLTISKSNKKYECLICGNNDNKNFFSYTNSFSYLFTYCKKCINYGISDNLNHRFTIYYPTNKTLKLTLPPVTLSEPQKNISDNLVDDINNKLNTLVWAVCGAGKTEIIYKTIFENLIVGKNVCIAIPRKDVVKELAIRIADSFKIDINILHGDNKLLNSSPLFIMTTHQLKNYFQFFDLIILDEVDAFPYNGDKILEYFLKKSLKINSPILFLSATPSKKIQKYAAKIHTLPIRYHNHLLDIPKVIINKKLIKYLWKNIIPTELKTFLDISLQNKRRVLIFVPTIKLITPVMNMLKENNYSAISVSSIDKKRSEKIEKFKNWQYNILVTTTILERGVTFDYLDVCIFNSDHSHFTKEALIQISGRVGRKAYAPTGEILFLATEKTSTMKSAIKEITYMNDLAKYRKLWSEEQ